MPPRLLIIADDLTGANDTGVQFAKQGVDVLVSIHHDQAWQALARDGQVLVVNTESRHLNADEAFQRVSNVARQALQLGIPQFYKKTDSTLRGNIGSELAALLEATGEQSLFFAPAYPKLHRTTRNGWQFVNGVALHGSSFAADPLNPMHDASIAAIIGQQTKTIVMPFDAQNTATEVPTIFVLDAETDEDLRRAARVLSSQKLLAGSAGWAEFLPAAMRLPSQSIETPTLSSPMLVVNGSLHPTSLQQLAHAAQHGWAVIEVTTETSVATIVNALHAEQRVAVTTACQPTDAHAMNRMAALIAQTLDQISLSALAVFGGDTLAALAQACDWKAFRPRTEFLPGVPLVEVCGEDKLILLTKAGGFGAEDLLLQFSAA